MSSQYCVLFVDQMLEIFMKRYVVAPYQLRKTFLGFLESVDMRSVEHTKTDQEFNVCNFRCNAALD